MSREAGRVERIVRYPVKGMAGVGTAGAVLYSGRGLSFDRELAVTNGAAPVGPDGEWTDSDAFHRLLVDAELAAFDVALTDVDDTGAELVVTGPDGRRLAMGLGSRRRPQDLARGDDYLRGWFADATPPRWCAPGVGLWDHRDAVLSIIDLDTLTALGAAAGTVLDPRRFRANLYVRGLGAGRETALAGCRVRIGGAELEVLRPIDRCRATTVDPDSATRDVNVPAALMRHAGHLFCGVYARVVRGGPVREGDELEPLGAPRERVLADGLAWRYARPTAEWPRPMVVTSTVVETKDVVSVWLRDPLRAMPSVAPAYLPGQHLRLHLDGPGYLTWRCYTISGVDGDGLRITVRRTEGGWISRLVHGLRPGDELTVSGPSGDVTLPDGDGPLLLLSAGVGITPVAAMLRGLADRSASRPIRVLHVTRSAADLALWPELTQRCAGLRDIGFRLYVTRDGEPPDPTRLPAGTEVRPGRPVAADIAAWATDDIASWVAADDRGAAFGAVTASTAQAVVCGPDGFLDVARDGLAGAGVPETQVHAEIFYSPKAGPADTAPAPEPGPFTVTHRRGAFVWTDQDGSLLDAAEQAGLTLPSACRSGACRTCVQRVTGATAYLDEPVLPPPAGQVLLCSAVPVEDVELDV